MASLRVIGSRERDLGGFTVRRVLPYEGAQMVGPFIFFDHLGPADFAPGTGIDVRPHPHIALATVTYLFAGAIEHRDSLGSVQEIRPGDVNWMTAGHGIVHSERTPGAQRVDGDRIHGIQSWVALPDGDEEMEPSFIHYPASALPGIDAGASKLIVVAGVAFGRRSPVVTRWPTLYVDALMPKGATLDVPIEHTERAAYVVQGAVEIAERAVIAEHTVTEGQLAIFDAAAHYTLRALEDARVVLLGGERFATPRFIWWNFVASSQERIERAKQRWAEGRFPAVPGETEFIPLPKS
jgi:redox-sensitive bicupin YhaK (pirin superfamily)